jgi:hypothetical protein
MFTSQTQEEPTEAGKPVFSVGEGAFIMGVEWGGGGGSVKGEEEEKEIFLPRVRLLSKLFA